MRFRKKRDEANHTRPGSEAEGLPVESASQRRRSRSGKRKVNAPLRIFSAIASHSLDAALALSDSLGPLKAPVSGVGHARDIWENVMNTAQDARALRSDIETFRTQLQASIPNPKESESAKNALFYVVEFLTRLDKELNDIEDWIEQFLGERVRSRILHWKEYDRQLKAARTKFQSSKDNFSVTFTFLTTILLMNQKEDDLDGLRFERVVQNCEERVIKNFDDLRRVVILITAMPVVVFDCGM